MRRDPRCALGIVDWDPTTELSHHVGMRGTAEVIPFDRTIAKAIFQRSFLQDGAVAVFYSSESSRNPYPEGSPPYDQSRYFQGMPRRLEPARHRALSQMYDLDFECRNPSGAVITTAMWADGEQFTADEPWEDVYDHGLWVLRTYLLPPEEALREWWAGMGFADSLRWAAWSLFERRIAATAPVITVEPREWPAFVEVVGGDPDMATRAEGMLADVGIIVDSHTDAADAGPRAAFDPTT